MEIRVISRSGKELAKFDVQENIKIGEFKKQFHAKCKAYIS